MMSILCCYRGRRVENHEPAQEIRNLPARPPRAKLSKAYFAHSDHDESIPQLAKAAHAPALLKSQLHPGVVDPTVLDDVESDEDMPTADGQNSSTGTLGVFKTKLIRRLSQRSGKKTKRQSQPSLGNSEEEVARRAELKRLMHKRIQEELKSEEEDRVADRYTRSPSLDNTKEPELPGGGPRDTIEFSVAGDSRNSRDSTVPKEAVALSVPPSSAQVPSVRRGSSCPRSGYRSHGSLSTDYKMSLRDRGSLPRFPSTPHLAPVHHISGHGSQSVISWRLDYSPGQLSPYLGVGEEVEPPQSLQQVESRQQPDDDRAVASRTESPPNASPTLETQITVAEPVPPKIQHEAAASFNSSDNDRYSPLDMWLRAQDIQLDSVESTPKL
ncbi:hypothetical protein F5Y15DRAFT_149606 [Xylariaceae sp. FL0016]|nr:hypothetical protein F5Y15DRAFT_149606 [Xylariaceae sp. FL0016]